MEHSDSATRNRASGRIETFAYPAGPEEPPSPFWEAWAGAEKSGAETAEAALSPVVEEAAVGVREAALRAEFDRRLAEEGRRSFEAGCERGRLEGRQAESEARAGADGAAEKRRVEQAAQLIESFTQERDRYLGAFEHEVVELALAVAARILRREAQMDPLLLTGAVRVALGQLAASTQARLRVPAGELELWTEAVALLPNRAVKPTVAVGEGMRLGDCEIETELGSVDLGIRGQLGEIERGFFDRAGRGGAEPKEPVSTGRGERA